MHAQWESESLAEKKKTWRNVRKRKNQRGETRVSARAHVFQSTNTLMDSCFVNEVIFKCQLSVTKLSSRSWRHVLTWSYNRIPVHDGYPATHWIWFWWHIFSSCLAVYLFSFHCHCNDQLHVAPHVHQSHNMQTLIPPSFTALWTSGTSDVTILRYFLTSQRSWCHVVVTSCFPGFVPGLSLRVRCSIQQEHLLRHVPSGGPVRHRHVTVMANCCRVLLLALLDCVCLFRLYLLYNHRLPQVLLYIFIILDLSLALFEEPAVIPLPSWVRPPCSANSSELTV